MSGAEQLLIVEHVKYRNSNAGRSPVGTLLIFREHVEWRDASSPERLKFSFRDIKGQRVSPPHKPKVQLQVCMHNDEQATFVFLKPGADKDALTKERDLVKETLQQALVAHRQRVQQLTQSSEKSAKTAELEAKQKILQRSKQLEELYKHLVSTKLITPQDFWKDYYKNGGQSEERVGITGAFLANIAQAEGSNGVKLNLNTTIIQNIFATYPIVERKHLELVPHEMTESEFWTKFFQSHYFHREREVLPNPSDPFAECVKQDEAEMEKLVNEGTKRKRLDFSYLEDNVFTEKSTKPESESARSAAKAVLIRRCNYLSERILATQQATVTVAVVSATNGQGTSNGSTSTNGAAPAATVKPAAAKPSGYAALNRLRHDDDDRLESADLSEDTRTFEYQPVKVDEAARAAEQQYEAPDAARFRQAVLDFLEDVSEEDILHVDDDDDWLEEPCSSSAAEKTMKNGQHHPSHRLSNGGSSNGQRNVSTMSDIPAAYISEVRLVHDAVAELSKHFWTCFPPISPELETKMERMIETIKKYEQNHLAEAELRFGANYFTHCRDMISRALARYEQFLIRRKK